MKSFQLAITISISFSLVICYESEKQCPIFNSLGLRRKQVFASSTCGDIDSSSQYCYGSPTILCSTCDEDEVNVRNVIDGNITTHWISRPGVTTANLTVDLLRPTRVTFMIISANEKLLGKFPTKREIHRSTDNGTTFIPWIYLVASSSSCPDGVSSDGEPNENQVACHTFDNPSFVIFSLVNNRDLPRCGEGMDFIYATHIRLVFLAENNEEMVNSSQIFYTVSELTIDGYCECNGYADQCLPINDTGLYQCSCLNGTCGQHCEQCCPLYNNAPYAAYGTGCVECNCSGNSESCEYNETLGMGVCISCKNNTTGINCEQCLPQYHPDSVSGLCIPCQCNENGTVDDGQCNIHGQCNCKEGYVFGPKCDYCPDGTFYDGDSCDDCLCPKNSSSGVQLPCDPFTGQCACPPNTIGLHCEMCTNDTWNLDIDVGCKPCNCNVMGAIGPDCNSSTGQCRCRDTFTGIDCSMCEDAYYQADGRCVPCNCHADGSHSLNCNSTTGKCDCKEHVEGQKCDQCEEGYYNITAENGCLSCSCDGNGSISPVCDNITGQCICQLGNAGRTCIDCETGYYIDMQTTLCLLCNCSESGSTSSSCDEDGRCDCKEGVIGEKCDRCDNGYWGFTSNGCKECSCFRDGTDGIYICNTTNGQCICNEGITGTKCDQCEGMDHYIIINGTCNACIGCSKNLIDDLLMLVNQTQTAIDLLYNENTNRFDRLRGKAMLVIGKVIEWSDNVNVSLCRLRTDAHCKPVIEMPFILRNYTRLLVELESIFPKLTDDVEDVVKLTYETFVALSMFEMNVTIANNNTKATLDKATQLLSEVTEKLKNVEQSFNDSEIALVTITERNVTFSNINNTVNRELNDAKMRDDISMSFLHNRTMENIRVNNISTQLEILQEVLQHIHSISVNVSTTVNNTVIYNSNLNSNITRLQMILNTTAILNNTIDIILNQTWEEYEDVNAMWTEAKELLENVSDIINTLNITALPCAINETDLFDEELEVVQALVENANNHSADLVDNSLLIINESFWLKYGRDIFENKSARINFTAENFNIQNASNAAQDATKQINESNLTSLEMESIQLNSTADLLSHQVIALSDNIIERRDEAENISKNVSKFKAAVMSKFMDVTTLQNEITTLNETVKKIVIGSINSSLLDSKDLVDVAMKTASQVNNKISDVEANINDTEANINFINSNITEINITDATLMSLSTNVTSVIGNFTLDVGDLMNKTKNVISEIDDIIQSLFNVHQEISLMNQRLRLTGKDGKEPFVSLQPPPGRALTDAVQYETIELFFRSNEIKNNTLLFYAGPAKAKDDKNDEILQQNDYMALLLQKANDDSNELILIYKLSGDVDAQQLVLRGSNFKEVVENRVYIARVGSTFTLALSNGDKSQQDSLSFSNGSSLFTGNNQTAFYIGGKPQDIELPSLVDATSPFSGVALLVLYNSQIWSLWNIRDSFSANFTVTPETSDLVGRLFDDTLALSFTGDGYLFTESLSSERSDNELKISIKPFSTEGLVMFAYDEQASLEVHYRSGNLIVIFNGSESLRSFKSQPGRIVTVTIQIIQQRFIYIELENEDPKLIAVNEEIFSDFTKIKSWFGGINSDVQLMISQTQSFFGCIGLTFNENRGIDIIQDHFIKYYVNSITQKRLSLDCLNAQHVHSASFNGSGRIEFDARSFPTDFSMIQSNNNFTSFSFEFAASEPNAGLLNANTKSGSLSIFLMNHSIHVTLRDKKSGEERHLISNHQLELGTLHFLLLYLNYMDTDAGYQLFIDDYLYDKADRFENEWKLDVFTSLESPKLILGAVDNMTEAFKGCMKNFAIQFRTIGFLSSKLSGTSGVTYHKCDVLESSREQPLLAIAAAEPMNDLCPPPNMSFTRLEGIQSCHVPNLTSDDNFTVQAIPERPNGLLLALTNSTDLIYAIGTKERKGLYYANNMTNEFSSDCPTLISVAIVFHDNTTVMISNNNQFQLVDVTQSGPLNLYIGGLPKNAIMDNRISFLQCSECDCPPGFVGQLNIQEIDLNHLVNSNEHSICEHN